MSPTIDKLLSRGVAEILPSREGLAKLMSERAIKLYQGFDPTGDKLHIGHAVALRKLRQFQDLGHEVIFLVGDGTGQAGDPSGKKLAREKFFNREELRQNAKDYVMQAGKIVRFNGVNPVKILYNGDWLNELKLVDILTIAQHFTIQQLIERDMYQERLKKGEDINLREFLYPLLQGYDSVAMEVDLELGGTDQTFNMLAGRKLVKAYLNKEKYVLSVPLLTDSKGVKIGKSEGNVIGLTDAAEDFFGKIMALSDDSIIPCFELLTDMPLSELAEMKHAIQNSKNPLAYKKQLAHELTKQFNSEEDAKRAQEQFEKNFQEKAPSYTREVSVSVKANITNAVATVVGSKSEAKRLIHQKAVDINAKTVDDPNLEVRSGDELKIGKRKFVTIKINEN